MKKIVLGVSSSIGIYKACEVLRGFQNHGYQVQVTMTRNAVELISPLLFSSLSGLNTIVDLFDDKVARTVEHVSLARETSLFCMAPATANIIAKFAGGIADDFPTTFFLAARCPVLVAPAMNEAMFFHPQTQANIARLKAFGVEFTEPEKGYLACGDEGWGRLAEPRSVVERGLKLIGRTESLKGKTVLVTAGPTREFMDPVRFISNPSSGKMGYELAREAQSRGARAVLVSGPTSLIPPYGVEFKKVGSAADMQAAVLEEFPGADIIVMAAAVSDFRFKSQTPSKKSKNEVPLRADLEKTPDILKMLGRKKRKQLLVGFAAETDQTVVKARAKMKDKNVDIMIANSVGGGMGFESDVNQVHIIRSSGRPRKTGVLSKREISRIIFDEIEDSLGKR
jgi:phosphopantothenoylcysteine decarboxylase/phosphopantothenate--cysteine ligase